MLRSLENAQNASGSSKTLKNQSENTCYQRNCMCGFYELTIDVENDWREIIQIVLG
jgi:hypothetical protein